MQQAAPQARIGVGTLLSPADVEGQARFIVETVAKGLTAEHN